MEQRIIAHISGKDDNLVKVRPLLEMVGDWKEFLLSGVSEDEREKIRHHEKTGRPLGSEGFIRKLKDILNRILQRQKPGRKRMLQGK